MKRKLIIFGSILMLTFYILIMTSAFVFKNPLTTEDNVIGQLDLIQQAAKNDDWQRAESEFIKGKQAWEKIKNRIQFSVEKIFVEFVDEELGTLNGAIKAQNVDMVIITTEKIKYVWYEMGH